MPNETSEQIVALQSRLATLEEVTQLFAQELNKAKEREESNKAQVREELNKAKVQMLEELNKVKERALQRSETLCPRFDGPFHDSRSGRFNVYRGPDIPVNRYMAARMLLGLPHGARLTSIFARGEVVEASSATRIRLNLHVVKWRMDPPESGRTIAEFEIQTGAGFFSGGTGGLTVTIDNAANWYSLGLSAFWDEPQTPETLDNPGVELFNIEIAYEIPQA